MNKLVINSKVYQMLDYTNNNIIVNYSSDIAALKINFTDCQVSGELGKIGKQEENTLYIYNGEDGLHRLNIATSLDQFKKYQVLGVISLVGEFEIHNYDCSDSTSIIDCAGTFKIIAYREMLYGETKIALVNPTENQKGE